MPALVLISGIEFSDRLSEVIEIDKVVLAPEYVTSYKLLEERFRTFPDSFIGLLNDDRLIGYYNFFPIRREALNLLISGKMKNDISLGKGDLHERLPEVEFDVYVITVAIHPQFQNGTAIKTLAKEFARKMRDWKSSKPKFRSIYASAVSGDGFKLLRRMGFDAVEGNPGLLTVSVDNFLKKENAKTQ